MTTIRLLDRTFPPYVETWSELDQFLLGKIDHARSYLDDDETAQSIGWERQQRHKVRLEAFQEVRDKIAPAVAEEAAERAGTAHEESIEQQYKQAGFDDMPPLIQRLMDGDR